MLNITQILSDEHKTILRVLDVVLKECAEIESGKTPDPQYFRSVIDFIKNYADKFHHAKEEDILFTAMLENIENLHCNPIPVMLHEHDVGRNFVKGMEAALDENNTEQLIENARGYCLLLQQHIYKEDNVLYPMAEQALTDDQKKLIKHKYDEVALTMKTTIDTETLKIS